ncbi:hypothetical protein FDK21_01380 [Cohaesibacter sp. CAU 1516]|uniref:hypothetical protein n=1 Tax=Cohaesibacter sp. CAU 1516 TaxID=2576038 RepID=UPI0010FEAA4D|nr:hypothetical protein [Cohaesibacter sp. CAU 1516]TLP48345.1 hypothetical protein FDK21_01380 [Cohaesibacter sp. CAU 1516]
MTCDAVIKEYELIYLTYESFNQHALALKGWSVTIGLATILAVYARPRTRAGAMTMLFAALSALPFWITDAVWKSYQNAYVPRIKALEENIACAADGEIDFNIYSSWRPNWGEFDWLGLIFKANVMMPHVFVLALGCMAFWLYCVDLKRSQ